MLSIVWLINRIDIDILNKYIHMASSWKHKAKFVPFPRFKRILKGDYEFLLLLNSQSTAYLLMSQN